jgi:branched-chain amino acid transport system substrate-binding protein
MSSRVQGLIETAAALLVTTMLLLATSFAHMATAAEEVTLGALLPLTGPAAPVGIAEQRGVQFAVARANGKGGIQGRQVKVFYEDSQGKPDQGMLAFNRLVDLHHVPVSLTAFSSVSLAIAPVATRTKVVVVNPAAQSSRLENASPYLFNTLPMVKDEAIVLAKFVVEKLGKKTAALIYENAAAGIDGRDDFKKAFVALGGKVLAEEPVEFGQTNYRPVLLKVASTRPEFVYISITQGHDAFAEQVGQVENFPLGVGNTFSRPFFGYASTLGWYQTEIRSEIPPAIDAEYAKMFPTGTSQYEDRKTVMGFFEKEYFNATNVVLTAIDRVLSEKGALTGEALRKAIFDIKTFEGVARITFTKNTASRQIDVVRLDKGVRTRVE